MLYITLIYVIYIWRQRIWASCPIWELSPHPQNLTGTRIIYHCAHMSHLNYCPYLSHLNHELCDVEYHLHAHTPLWYKFQFKGLGNGLLAATSHCLSRCQHNPFFDIFTTTVIALFICKVSSFVEGFSNFICVFFLAELKQSIVLLLQLLVLLVLLVVVVVVVVTFFWYYKCIEKTRSDICTIWNCQWPLEKLSLIELVANIKP